MILFLYPSSLENLKLLYKKPIWNKGLTKETDERVAKYSQCLIGTHPSQETKEKQRQAKLGKKQSKEHIEKRIKTQYGRIKSKEEIEKTRQKNIGKKRSDEHKEKIRKTHLGKIESQETREKKRLANIGKHQSPETIEKRRQKLIGIKHSPERIEKQRLTQIRNGKHIGNNYSRNSYAHGDYHLTPNQGIMWMRSSWEIKLALYLEQNNIDYYYELYAFEMTINNKKTTYRPDFFLPVQNKFIEVKGRKNCNCWEDCDAKLKSDKFRDEFCKDWSYEVLFKKDLKNIGIRI